MLLVSWPIPLLTGLLLYRLGDLLAPWAAFMLLGVWLVSGFFFLRLPAPAPDAIGPDRGGHPAIPRRPTADEAEVLDPAWRHTLRVIGLTESTFSVCVRDSPGPLGSAHPSGLVTVSAEAVREFSPAELRGLLGHEIGHLVGDGGGVWYRLSWWYTGLLRMLFVTVGSGSRWLARRWLSLAVMAAAQLGVLVGMVVLLRLLFGSVVAVALLAAAATQMVGQRTVLRRNQTTPTGCRWISVPAPGCARMYDTRTDGRICARAVTCPCGSAWPCCAWTCCRPIRRRTGGSRPWRPECATVVRGDRSHPDPDGGNGSATSYSAGCGDCCSGVRRPRP
ncbi:M48 family metalloprotease [Nocardia sp. NPDC059091]|uniref:M48 family metalloprotease n=1 Tax=Nocardia sp. NPDC059091 TaxID=3346724 RepID=UPI00367C100D